MDTRKKHIQGQPRENLIGCSSIEEPEKERKNNTCIHTYIISGWLFLSQRFGASRVQLNGTCLFRYAAYLTGARGNHIGAATKMWLLVVKKKERELIGSGALCLQAAATYLHTRPTYGRKPLLSAPLSPPPYIRNIDGAGRAVWLVLYIPSFGMCV